MKEYPISTEDRTARDLLQIGRRLLIQRPDTLLDGGLRSEDVINIANSSHATFYRKFSTKSKYLTLVLRDLVDTSTPAAVDLPTAVHAAVALSDGDRRRALRKLVQDWFDTVFSDEFTAHRLLATTLGATDPHAGRTLHAAYARTDRWVLEIFEILFSGSGVTLRKPFTARTFAVAVTAVVEGFLIRKRADPAAVTAELVADAVLAVLNIALENNQRHSHVDDALTAIDESYVRAVQIPSEPRAALLAAAGEEFVKRGYFMATVEAIADAAGVPIDAALRIFPTKAHMIIGALKTPFDLLGQGIDDDIALGHNDIAVVEHHFLRCARLVAEHRTFMDALMAVVAHDTYAEPDGLISIKRELNFPALLAPVIENGQRNGTFANEQPAGELAALLTDTLILRCFTRRSLSPEENADFVSHLVLSGLRRAQ